jgi:hypothetical protein
MRLSERIYRMLLKAYPRRYRAHYGEPMAQLFADQLRAAHSFGSFALLWMRNLVDLMKTVPARHLEPRRSRFGFETWSTPARRSVFYARYEASSFGHHEIAPEHLLLGILRGQHRVPELAAAAPEMVRAIEAAEARPRRRAPRENLRVGFVLRDALELAKHEAERAHAPSVTTHHLLAAILQKEQTLAAQLLRQHGIDLDKLRSAE